MNGFDGLGNVYGTPIGYGVLPPSSGTVTAMESMIPAYGTAMTEAAMAKTAAVKSDSGLTYAAIPVSRKRTRDAINPLVSSDPNGVCNQTANNRCGGSVTFLGEDLSLQFQQQQLEVDRFIAQHVRYTQSVRDLLINSSFNSMNA